MTLLVTHSRCRGSRSDTDRHDGSSHDRSYRSAGFRCRPVDDDPADDIADIVLRLQSEGLRLGAATEGRKGGAGPSDVGMLWVEDLALTLDTDPARVEQSPFELRVDDAGAAIYEDGRRVATARTQSRPRYYDLTTADGVPYWKIALLHLDSLASTVLQTCAYWGNEDQCTFCGIGLTLEAGRTIAKKTPAMLAEVAVAARDLDGAVDATLTTGSTRSARTAARSTWRSAGRRSRRPAGCRWRSSSSRPRTST